VFAALGSQRAMRMRRIAVCDLSGSTEFFRIFDKRYDFRKKKLLNKKHVF
jgi:hypothetical protein